MEVNFAKMHIFKYSKREGTKAAVMAHQVEDSVKAARSSQLLQLDEKLRRNYMEKFLNRRINVLFEERIEIKGETFFVGHTREYLKVAVKTEENLANRIIQVETRELLNNEIILAIF